MLEGAKLKNKEKKPKYNFRMETRKTKQEHDTKSKKWNDNGRKDEGRRKLMWWIWEVEHATWSVICLQDKWR